MTGGAPVVIVGSGPLGIAVARRLAGAGFDVTVLEAGPAITDPPGAHFRNQPRFARDPDAYFPAIERYLRPLAPSDTPSDTESESALPGAADSAVVGGQGVLWTNNCPRMADFERWDAMSPPDWERCYLAAEDLLQVVADPSAGSRTGAAVEAHLEGPLAAEGRVIRGLPLAGRLISGGRLHFVAPRDLLDAAAPDVRARIALRTGVTAERLLFEGARVSGVEVRGPDGRATLAAERVVVAGGAVATPALLHRSGIRPAALGRGLSFHACLFGQVVLVAEDCPGADERDLAPRLWIPPSEAAPWHIQVLRDTCPLPPDEPVENPHRLFEFQAFLPVEFRPENALVFDDAGRAGARFAFSARDRAGMAAMAADVERLAAKLGPWRGGRAPTWLPHGAAHLVGTCAMDLGAGVGVTDRPGVTDRVGAVHGVENLHLATVGLIPRPVAENPTLTALALALRTCEAIAAEG